MPRAEVLVVVGQLVEDLVGATAVDLVEVEGSVEAMVVGRVAVEGLAGPKVEGMVEEPVEAEGLVGATVEVEVPVEAARLVGAMVGEQVGVGE